MKIDPRQIEAQHDAIARLPRLDTAHRFVHIGVLRASPKARTGRIGFRFYETPDLLGQRLDHGVIWESIEVVPLAQRS